MKTLEQRIFDGAIWLIAASLLLVVLTSCSAAIPAPGTATAEPSPSATATSKGNNVVTFATPAPDTCTVTTGYERGTLNSRTGPGTRYAVIRVLTEGETLTVIARGA